MRRLLDCRSGIGAVEFALVLPVLVVLLMGVSDFALAVNEKMRLVAAARAGAQAAYRASGDTAGVAAAVHQATGLDAAGLVTSATNFCGCASGAAAACDSVCADGNGLRSYVTVTVTETWTPVLSYPGMGALALSGQVTLRVK